MRNLRPFNRIVVRSPNWIGDQALAYPFFYSLRKVFPASEITVACVPWVKSIQYLNLVDHVVTLPVGGKSLFDKFKMLKQSATVLRPNGPWDLGILLPNSFSSAWIFFRSRVRVRRGYLGDGRAFLLNQGLKSEPMHRSQAYLRILTELDSSYNSFPFDPALGWPEAVPLPPPDEPYFVLAPGATAESRRWPIQSFINTTRLIQKETGWKGIILGGDAEKSVAQQLSSDSTLKLENWTCRGSVASLWKIFRHAKFSLCNDSGLAHIAALCGSFVQIAWGGGNPKNTEPVGPGRVQKTVNRVECWPCEKNVCQGTERLACLNGITPEKVWEEIKSGIKTS